MVTLPIHRGFPTAEFSHLHLCRGGAQLELTPHEFVCREDCGKAHDARDTFLICPIHEPYDPRNE